MKILSLRFKNLNALYGEWLIDFSSPDYVDNGIFALIGPTGAGKSTLLDGICLALYGATPRLGKITQSSNELLSRQRGDCYAEVVFNGTDGRYRCHWQQRRARKKADGKLQPPEHQFIDDSTGKPLATQKNQVSKLVEEKTGMDFDRFTRSVLLAQGSFDSFLRADSEQKSKLLEQITGTAIYSAISRRTHDFLRQAQEALDKLLAEVQGIQILSAEQEQDLTADIQREHHHAKELTKQLQKTTAALQWLDKTASLQQEITQLGDAQQQLQKRLSEFLPKRQQLALADTAATLDSDYSDLLNSRRQQSDYAKEIKSLQAKLPKLNNELQTRLQALSTAEHQAQAAKTELKHSLPKLTEVRLLDQALSTQQQQLHTAHQQLQDEQKKQQRNKRQLQNLRKQQGQLKQQQHSLQATQAEHAKDQTLLSELSGIAARLNDLRQQQQQFDRQQQQLQAERQQLNTAQQQLADSQAQQQAAATKLKDTKQQSKAAQDKLKKHLNGKLLREYHSDKEALLRELALLAKITELQDHREQLIAGQPCPLCGSTHHPYADDDHVPQPNAVESKIQQLNSIISRAEQLQQGGDALQQAEAAAETELHRQEQQLLQAQHRQQEGQSKCDQLQADTNVGTAQITQLQQQLTEQLQAWGNYDLGSQDAATMVLTDLQQRLHTWQDNDSRLVELTQKLTSLDHQITQLDKQLNEQQQSLATKQTEHKHSQDLYTDKLDKRRTQFGEQDPDNVEQQLNAAVEQAEKQLHTQQQNHDEHARLLQTTTTKLDDLQQRQTQHEQVLQVSEKQFVECLHNRDFADEAQFVSARLSLPERRNLSEQAKQLDNENVALSARLSDKKTQLDTEKTKCLTDKSPPELQQLQQQQAQQQQQQLAKIAADEHQLQLNQDAKKQLASRQQNITAHRQQVALWEQLHHLIGSADGKKYRNFAQGLTFELMVGHANHQLLRMTDRYLLSRDKEQPLALNVIDQYQGGEVRSVKNLSGGESFIVSLALALGLSKMVGQTIRVDSLFLDEGFGTLDDDSLETALEALSTLHHEGKLIGVISHVSALKDSISTQINVVPTSGGRSVLSGPGCQRLAQT